jgi:hypothetical protein
MKQMINKMEEQRFEFIMYINKNIICSRSFSIKDFNEDSLRSIELRELMDKIVGIHNGFYMGIIPRYLKKVAMEYMWKFYNPHNNYQQKFEEGRNIFEKEDIFDFEIRLDKRTIAQSTFSGNYFPQQVRYQVNIKEVIPNIMSEIKYALSQNNYSTSYADVKL